MSEKQATETTEETPAVIETATTEPLLKPAEESPAVTNEEKEVAFIDTINEDLRESSNLKDFSDVNQLAKSYVELQRMVGNSVRIPPADASDESKKEFLSKIKDVEGIVFKDSEDMFSQLGRPATPEDYKIELDEKLTEQMPSLSEEILEFNKIAHEAGLTNEQVNTLVDMRSKEISSQLAEVEQQRQTATETLKKAWGSDFDNRLNAVKQVTKIYSEKYGDEISDLINSPAGDNPALLLMLSDLALSLKEKGHVGVSDTQFGMTPEGAKDKIAEKKADIGFQKAYHDDRHPGHNKAVAELTKLYDIANA